MPLRFSRSLRDAASRGRPVAFILALLLGAAVVFAGNHCELGGMKTVAPREHSCCTPTPSDAAVPPEYSECCAPLEVPLPGVVKAPIAQFIAIFTTWEELALPPVAVFELAGQFGPSPPGLPPVLESVLRRSAPAHGPPPFVV